MRAMLCVVELTIIVCMCLYAAINMYSVIVMYPLYTLLSHNVCTIHMFPIILHTGVDRV